MVTNRTDGKGRETGRETGRGKGNGKRKGNEMLGNLNPPNRTKHANGLVGEWRELTERAGNEYARERIETRLARELGNWHNALMAFEYGYSETNPSAPPTRETVARDMRREIGL